MRVDCQRGAGILGPHVVDVGRIVIAEQGVVQRDTRVRGTGAQISTVGRRDDQPVPAGAIAGILGPESVADSIQAVGGKTLDDLGFAAGGGQGEGDGQRDKVDVGDVHVELGVVPGEFTKVPEQIIVRVGRVGGRWLHQRGAGVHEEGQLAIAHEPQPGAGQVRDCHRHGIPRGAEGDPAVLGQRRQGRRWRGWVVGRPAV